MTLATEVRSSNGELVAVLPQQQTQQEQDCDNDAQQRDTTTTTTINDNTSGTDQDNGTGTDGVVVKQPQQQEQQSSSNIRIRCLREKEIPKLLELCKAEGRHMGLAPEVQSWFRVDPSGFFVAVNESGEIVGSCCGIRLSALHANVGMYVVRSDCRGGGLGKQLWNAAIEHVGPRNKGLSAVAQLFPVYRDRAGFSFVADWSVDLCKLERPEALKSSMRRGLAGAREVAPYIPQAILCQHHQRLTNPVQTPDIRNGFYLNNHFNRFAYDNGGQIGGLTNQALHAALTKFKTLPIDCARNRYLIPDVIEYDRSLNGYDRAKIVQYSLSERNSRCRVALQGDKVVGYGCLKPNLQGLWMLSPLYADSEKIARMLLFELAGSLSSSELTAGIVLKSPSNNEQASSLLNTLGFERQTYSLKRCYTHFVWDTPTRAIFALHSSVFCSE